MPDVVNFSAAPRDPMKRLMWLSGVREAVDKELEAEFAKCYFDLRLKGDLRPALDLKFHSLKRVLAWCRRENDRRGRPVRWNDGLDPTSRKS